MQALGEIRNFVQLVEPNDRDAAVVCRLALQLCGRCRERNVVKQNSLKLCGGYAALQAAWGQSPLSVTRIILKLISDHEVILGKRTFKLPENIDYSKYGEALADNLLLSCFYDVQHSESSSYKEDMIFSALLGNEVKSIRCGSRFSRIDYIRALESATDRKAAVRLSLKKSISNYVLKNRSRQLSRKASDQVQDIEEELQSSPKSTDLVAHAVSLDKIRLSADKKRVDIKIQTWGEVMWLRMNTETFMNNIFKNRTVIQHGNPEALKEENISKVFSSVEN